jgi:hypothetical protein
MCAHNLFNDTSSDSCCTALGLLDDGIMNQERCGKKQPWNVPGGVAEKPWKIRG